MSQIGNLRNKPCPCGSGKKFKKCCLLQAEGLIHISGQPIHITRVETPLSDNIASIAEITENVKQSPDFIKGQFTILVRSVKWYQEIREKIPELAFTDQELANAEMRRNGFIGMKNNLQCFISMKAVLEELQKETEKKNA